jgi:hypothetical protein
MAKAAKELQQNISESRQIIVDLLFTDLDLALTFLETARVSDCPETKERNVANALKAYRESSAKALKVNVLPSTRQDLQRMLNTVAERLLEFGAKV